MKPKSTLRSFLTITASTLLAISYTHAADFTWDNSADPGVQVPATGTWTDAAAGWTTGGTTLVNWSAANVAIFGGADGTYAVEVGGAISAQKILFNNSGYTLSAAAPRTITITSPGSNIVGNVPGLSVATTKSATIGSNVSVLGNATFYIGAQNGTAGGTLNIEGGLVGTVTTGSSVVIDGDGSTVNVKAGGTLRLSATATSTGSSAIVVGQLANSNATLNVQGGNVLVNNNSTGTLFIGNGGRGSVTLTNGTIEVPSTASNGVTFGNSTASGDNVLHLNGGNLITRVVRKGAGAATATFNFNGGTLRANASNATFMQGLTTANVKAGGAVIDTQAFNITIAQALLNDGGGLTKDGAGTLTLAGANTYNGATTVNTGKLKLSSAGTSASNVTVASAASGGPIVAATDGQHVSSGNLSLSNGSNLVIDYGTTTPGTLNAPLQVVDFNPGTGIGLQIEGSTAPVAGPVYPLVKWTGAGPANASAFSPFALPSGLVANFAVDVPNKTLTVTFVAPPPISWNTGNDTWDTDPGNTVWLTDALASVAYTNNVNKVLFGDATSAGTDPVVTLDSALTPLGVTMNSTSRNYTISGGGGIGGVAGITLDASNTRTHTLTTANTYTGPTAVNGGVLRLGDGGANGSLSPASAISVASGATFAVNQSDTVTQGTEFGVISGDGGYTQNGGSGMVPGNTVLNVVNTFTGPIAIAKGNLEIGANGQLGGGTYAGTIDIALGASVLQYGSTLNQTLSGIISGAGSLVKSGSGTLTLSGANTYTGATTVSQGVLSIGALDALTTTSGITLGGASAATLSSSLTGITLTAPITTANSGVNSTIAFGRSTAAAGSLTLNGAIGGLGNVIFNTPFLESANNTQSIDLGAAGTYAGSTTITTQTPNNTIRVRNTSGAANALPAATVLTLDGGVGPSGDFVRSVSYDLNGQNQTLAGLTNIARTKRNQRITNGDVGLATLTINNSTDYTFGGSGTGGTVSWSTRIVGNIALTKTGASKFTLAGSHEYTGDTTVTLGILSQSADNTFNNLSTVTIAEVATLDLNFAVAGTDTVDKLFIGNIQQPMGVYGALLSGAQFETARITGNSTLTVTTGPLLSGYAAWAATNAGGEASNLDTDKDGVSNGVEFFMGITPASPVFTANPQLSGSAPRIITWPNGGNIPASAYGTQFVIQTSSNLSTWTPVLVGDLTTNTDGPGGSLTYTLTGGSPRFVRLAVTPN